MDPILLCGVLFSVLTLSLYYLLTTFKTSANPGRLPPGKTGWPLIGESIEFLSYMQTSHLEKFTLKRMVKYSPDVFKTSIFGDHVAVFCGAAGCNFLFFKSNKVLKRWVTKPIRQVLSFDDQRLMSFDRYIKPKLLRFLKLEGLTYMVGIMDVTTQHYLQSRWHGVQVITAYSSVKRYAFILACRFLLSIEDPDVVESLFDSMETLSLGMQSIPIDIPGTQMNRSVKVGNKLKEQIQQIIKQLRSMKSTLSPDKMSFISSVLQACEDDKDVAHGVMVLLLAGHETVASVICMILKVMADDPHIYDRVYEENMSIGTPGELLTLEDTHKMRYTWNVVREVMRMYPPAPFVTREAMADFTYAGYHIPKGYKIITDIHATHKDPKHFREPQKFDPSRFEGDGPLPNTYIPFGAGTYMCPGNNYAQLVMLVFIHNVVKRFKWESVIADEKIVGIPHPKPSQGLPIILHPHSR